MDAFWAAPPITRTWAAATLLISLAVYGSFLSFARIVFSWVYVFKFPPEVWRLVTSFCLSGPQLAIIFDPYFIWQYAGDLETNSPRFTNPGDFFVYIVFVGSFIVLVAGQILGSIIFTHALILAIAYTYAQDNRGKKIRFFIINMDVKWLPYATLLLTFIMASPVAALHQSIGIPAAHCYDFLTRLWPMFGGGKNCIATPRLVARWFGGSSDAPRVVVKKNGTVFRPPTETIGFSSGWSARGSGRRLGGE